FECDQVDCKKSSGPGVLALRNGTTIDVPRIRDPASKKGSIVGVSHLWMTFDTHARRRRGFASTPPITISTTVAGSGTEAGSGSAEGSAEPLPGASEAPKLARQALYIA